MQLRYLLLYVSALIGLMLLTAACRRSSTVEDAMGWQAALDSTIRLNLRDIYTNPAITHSRLQALMKAQKDSADRWRVALYDAIARREMGDSLATTDVRQRVVDWCRRHPGHDALEGLAWNHRGVDAQQAGDLDKARRCIERACRLLDGNSVDESLVNAYINAADVNLHSGRPVTAAQHYRRALFLADSLHLKQLMPAINSGLGLVYSMLDNFKEADRYLDEAERYIAGETDNGQYFYYMTRGNCYFFEQRYDSAIVVFDNARAIASRMRAPDLVARSEGNIGEAHLRAGRTAQAARYINRGERYARRHPDVNPSLRFYLFSLAVDLALSENRLNDAERLLRNDIDTTAVDEPRYMALHYNRLQRYAEKRHLWHDAYRLQSQARHYDDSLKSQQTLNNIIEIRSRYEQDATLLHQRVVIADYEVRTSRQQAFIAIILLGLVILILTTITAVIILRRRADRRYRTQVEQMSRLRMDIIQNRVQPHYIFNVLGTVLPRFSNYPDLSHSINLLIDVLRSNLLVAGKTAITLSEERLVVERYVSLHRLTHGQLPVVKWQVADGVPDDILVPAMCLQIPVENALKHAFPVLTADCAIDITITYAAPFLRIRVLDNGAGYNPGHIQSTGRDTGTGLRVLARTIELLNKHNTLQAGFSIVNRPGADHGTEVSLIIPDTYNWEL